MGLRERYRALHNKYIGPHALTFANEAQKKGFTVLPASTRVDIWVVVKKGEKGKLPRNVQNVTLIADQEVRLPKEPNLKISEGEITFVPYSPKIEETAKELQRVQKEMQQGLCPDDYIIDEYEQELLNDASGQTETKLRQGVIDQIPTRRLDFNPDDVLEVTIYNVRRLKNPHRKQPKLSKKTV